MNTEIYNGSLKRDWKSLGEDEDHPYFQQLVLNSNIEWFSYDLDTYIIAVSKYSGYIALKWNKKQASKPPLDKSFETDILICNTKGEIIYQIKSNEAQPWHNADFLYMNWTEEDLLYTVYSDGQIVLYNCTGAYLENYHLFNRELSSYNSYSGRRRSSMTDRSTKESLDMVMYAFGNELGCVLVTTTCKMYHVQFHNIMNDTHVDVVDYPILPLQQSDKIVNILTIEPRFSKTKQYEFIIVTKNENILYRDEAGDHERPFMSFTATMMNNIDGSENDNMNQGIQFVCLSPDRKYIAFYAHSRHTYIYDLYMQRLIASKDWEGLKIPLKYFGWIGNEYLYYYWDRTGLCICDLFTPSRQDELVCFDYPMYSIVKIVDEIDCIRIYTTTTVDIVRQVPKCLVDIYENPTIVDTVSYMYPSAQLYDSYAKYIDNRGGGSVVDTEFPLKDLALYNGVFGCYRAAEEEFSIQIQQDYLNIGRYGLCFYNALPTTEPTQFLMDIHNTPIDISQANNVVCLILRLLNTLRTPEIGIYITYEELMCLGLDALIRRLYERQQYSLAIQIANLFDYDISSVIIHWCMTFIGKSALLSDEAILEKIIQKVNSFQTKEPIHYAQIAQAAIRSNRTQLAGMLVEQEQSLEEQISLLLTLKEDEIALKKAIQSNSCDYILRVILGFTISDESTELDLKQITEYMINYPSIQPIVFAYFKDTNMEIYEKLIYALKNDTLKNEFHIAALVHLLEENQYQLVSDELEDRKQEISKQTTYLIQEFEFEKKLVDAQKKIVDGNKDVELIGKSSLETLYKLIGYENEDLLKKFIKAFGITDKEHWSTRCRYYSDHGMWDDLQKFIQTKKRPPLSYEALANYFIQGYQYDLAKVYILKMSDNQYKLRLLVTCEQWSEASELAYKLRSKTDLLLIYKKVQGIPELKSKVELFCSKF